MVEQDDEVDHKEVDDKEVDDEEVEVDDEEEDDKEVDDEAEENEEFQMQGKADEGIVRCYITILNLTCRTEISN